MAKRALSVPWTRTLNVETAEPVGGVLKGSVPSWLEGSLIRNGSAIYQIGEEKYNHLFDGLSVLHKFDIKNGNITYMNKALKSETYKKNFAANRIVVSEYGTRGVRDPCLSLFGKLMNRFSMGKEESTDNCGVNICYIADGLYAMTESRLLRRIDPDTLETKDGVISLNKYVGVHHATAHPHVEPDGTVYNMGNFWGQGSSYKIIEFPPKSDEPGQFPQGKIVASIPVDSSRSRSYFHSFGITENYFIFAEISVVFSMTWAMLSNLRQAPISDAFGWDPNTKSRFHLVHRKTGERNVYTAEPFFTFHHINAFEEDGHVVVDLCGSDDGRLMNQLLIEKMDSSDGSYGIAEIKPRRYVLPEKLENAEVGQNLVTWKDTSATAIKEKDGSIAVGFELLVDHSSELPRINYKLNGKPYRYFYSIALEKGTLNPKEMIKVDIKEKSIITFKEDGKTMSEPVFVPRPGATEEDDGVILASILDDSELTKVALIILDAKTFKEIARSDFAAKGTVPKDFHGIFTAANESVHLY